VSERSVNDVVELYTFRPAVTLLEKPALAAEVGFRIYGNSELALAQTRLHPQKRFIPHDLPSRTEAELIVGSFEETKC